MITGLELMRATNAHCCATSVPISIHAIQFHVQHMMNNTKLQCVQAQARMHTSHLYTRARQLADLLHTNVVCC
jgi:hypothetical protein